MFKNDTPERIFVFNLGEDYFARMSTPGWSIRASYSLRPNGNVWGGYDGSGADRSYLHQRPVLFMKKQMKAHLLKVR